jgi:hypothetical protein
MTPLHLVLLNKQTTRKPAPMFRIRYKVTVLDGSDPVNASDRRDGDTDTLFYKHGSLNVG